MLRSFSTLVSRKSRTRHFWGGSLRLQVKAPMRLEGILFIQRTYARTSTVPSLIQVFVSRRRLNSSCLWVSAFSKSKGLGFLPGFFPTSSSSSSTSSPWVSSGWAAKQTSYRIRKYLARHGHPPTLSRYLYNISMFRRYNSRFSSSGGSWLDTRILKWLSSTKSNIITWLPEYSG